MNCFLQFFNIILVTLILYSTILCGPYLSGRGWEVKESDTLHPPGIVHSPFRLHAVTTPLERGKAGALYSLPTPLYAPIGRRWSLSSSGHARKCRR
jgi:hypothetical protein